MFSQNFSDPHHKSSRQSPARRRSDTQEDDPSRWIFEASHAPHPQGNPYTCQSPPSRYPSPSPDPHQEIENWSAYHPEAQWNAPDFLLTPTHNKR